MVTRRLSVSRFDRQEAATGAAERWRNQYSHTNQDGEVIWSDGFHGNRWPTVYKELAALGKAPNPDDVDRVTGNTSWTHFQCDSCYKEVATGLIIECGAESHIEACDGCAAASGLAFK